MSSLVTSGTFDANVGGGSPQGGTSAGILFRGIVLLSNRGTPLVNSWSSGTSSDSGSSVKKPPMQVSIYKLANVVTALKNLQHRAVGAQSPSDPSLAPDGDSAALRPTVDQSTGVLSIEIPEAESLNDSNGPSMDRLAAVSNPSSAPSAQAPGRGEGRRFQLVGSLVHGQRFSTCVFDILKPTVTNSPTRASPATGRGSIAWSGAEQQSSSASDGVGEVQLAPEELYFSPSFQHRLIDSRQFTAILIHQTLALNVPPTAAADHGPEVVEVHSPNGKTIPHQKLANRLHHLLDSIEIQESGEKKEENFQAKDVLTTATAEDPTFEFMKKPTTNQALLSNGLLPFLGQVASFVDDVVNEQKKNAGLFFLQQRAIALLADGKASQTPKAARAFFGRGPSASQFVVAGTSEKPTAGNVGYTVVLDTIAAEFARLAEKVGSTFWRDAESADGLWVTTIEDASSRKHRIFWKPLKKRHAYFLTQGEGGVAEDADNSLFNRHHVFLLVAAPTFTQPKRRRSRTGSLSKIVGGAAARASPRPKEDDAVVDGTAELPETLAASLGGTEFGLDDLPLVSAQSRYQNTTDASATMATDTPSEELRAEEQENRLLVQSLASSFFAF